MIVTEVDGLRVRLRAPHDLSFLSRWGTVFAVLDQQDSGNLCLGAEGPGGRVFVKYAGAPTARYEGVLPEAVDRARRAGAVYRSLTHPSLVRLREAVDVGAGHALVFDWTDATPVGRQYERSHVVRSPVVNRRGRMWGSARFMSPEEHELGAVIDEVTNVVALGALAHTFLGDDATKSRATWVGSDAQYAVAARALRPERQERWPSVAALAEAWREASLLPAPE